VFQATDVRTGTVVTGESALQVLAAAGRQVRVDAVALCDYLATGRVIAGSRTLFAEASVIPRRCEAPLSVEASGARTLEESAEMLRQLLWESVAADASGGRVAIALSGGIDSSGLLAMAARQRPGEPAEAFCFAGDPGEMPPGWDELPQAQLAARACGATLHPVTARAEEVPDLVGRAVLAQDFPFASPVVGAQLKVFAAMKQAGHDIVLGGHGPEILFGGSAPQAALAASRLLRRGRLLAAARLLSGSARELPAPRGDLLRSALGHVVGLAPLRQAGASSPPWASARWFADRMTGPKPARVATGDPGALIDELLSKSLGATSLAYEARNAADRGLESRQPYLASPLVAFARALPLEHGLSPNGVAKQVLRRALRGLVPEEILTRRGRLGFAVPALAWLLRQPAWTRSRLAELRRLPFFDGPTAAQAWAALEGGGEGAWVTAWRAWRWIVLLEWATARNARFE
jgi:asparagine synthase (glutamine-hydrolysing)